jgi:Aerobic-type carbon monoxide dehydrogenase, small subunit CoxS/CutS homologs
MTVSFMLNDRPQRLECSPGETLKTVLGRAGLVSLREGCDGEGSCGLCAVLLDGRLVNSCMILAPEAQGRVLISVEHFDKDPVLRTIQRALIDSSCVQCGYCTPAVVLAARELLSRSLKPTDAQIADALSGTLCRCTGYKQFFEAVHLAAARLSDPGYAAPAGRNTGPICATWARTGKRWTPRCSSKANGPLWRTGCPRMSAGSGCWAAPSPTAG